MHAPARSFVAAPLALVMVFAGCQTSTYRSTCSDCGSVHADDGQSCGASRALDSDELMGTALLVGVVAVVGLATKFVTGPTPPPAPVVDAPWPDASELEVSGSADGHELSAATRARITDPDAAAK